MKDQKLDKLFASARNDISPLPPEDFAGDVLRAVRRDSKTLTPPVYSIFDQLSSLFPRMALVATAIILLCLVADYGVTAAGTPTLADGAAQLSAQQMLPSESFSL